MSFQYKTDPPTPRRVTKHINAGGNKRPDFYSVEEFKAPSTQDLILYRLSQIVELLEAIEDRTPHI